MIRNFGKGRKGMGSVEWIGIGEEPQFEALVVSLGWYFEDCAFCFDLFASGRRS